ncbi:MtN3-like protein [Phytophthora palmivora]|uniref:MtN3-like protein n=1 Tax=Phytophthora palmivora TaxID=4796 RepID=A0A2P4YCL4_9STRA|nr:MtN3-like protein [Phytophthora palmivora]
MTKEVAVLIFRVLAGIATIGLASSPALLMFRIYKQQHVGVASVFPLAALLGSSHIWVVYGYLIENYFPLVSCFLYGECCGIVFLSIYCYYSSDKCYVFRVLTVVLTIVVTITIYATLGSLGYTGQTISSVKTVMGLIAVVGGACLYGAPMEKLFQVVKHKSAVFINAHMVIAGLTSNILWLTYGILITNYFIMSINGLFLTFNVFTLVLFRIYDPKTHPLQDGWNTHTDNDVNNQVEISVRIENTSHQQAMTSTTSLTNPLSPVYTCLPSP